MRSFIRTAVFLAAVALLSGVSAQEGPRVLLTVSVLDEAQRPVPVARHALLISDNPPTAAPRLVTTSLDGTAQVRLPPGRYIVESDRPFVFGGRTYEWVQTFAIVAGRDTTIDLTMTNASVGVAPADAGAGIPSGMTALPEQTPSTLTSIVMTWQASTFGLWTPLAHAGGFLADPRGLVATSLRALGDATPVAVQISSTVKVAGDVLVSDPATDIAVVRVDPSVLDGIRHVPLACDAPTPAPEDSDRYVITVPLLGPADISPSLVASPSALGGPVFSSAGRPLGLASPSDASDPGRRVDARLVGEQAICEALRAARAVLDSSRTPSAARLPVEPLGRPSAAIARAGTARPFTLAPYQLSSSDFDVTFLTPQVLAAAEGRRGWTGGRVDELNGLRIATDFEHWSDYVASAPPLLFVRVTPRLVEGFWMKIARGAASTQGAQIPPIKRLRPGFSRMRLVCGGTDLTPIHPFRIQARVNETEAVEEGFYVFDPASIGPHCGAVAIVLSSVKDPDRTETRIVDPALVRRVWDDFSVVR